MRHLQAILLALCVFGALTGSRLEAQTSKAKTPPRSFTAITQHEMTVLLRDVAETNPQILKQLQDDPELRRAQLENLKQLLAFAFEAQRSGLADEPVNRKELSYIADEVKAVNYDRHVNKEKEPRPPFGHLPEARVGGYWGDGPGSRLPASLKADRNAKFEEFFETKVGLLRSASPDLKDKVVTDEEKKQARDVYAKIRIYAAEYARRSALLPLPLRQKIDLQIKLHQAQFLARLFAEILASQVTVSDDEIANYVKLHPEFDDAALRAKAEKILARAKSGDDFAKLANEFSEDPGNKNQENQPQGGLYQNVNKGVMIPAFEKAALALEPGQVSPALVETDFGFHIVKLERTSSAPDETYDVRHILISTRMDGPDGPGGRTMSLKDHVKKQVELEKEQKIIAELVAASKISVPNDFVVPAVAPKTDDIKAGPKRKTRPARKRT